MNEIDYIVKNNLLNAQPVTRDSGVGSENDPYLLAQLCGPIALQKLLTAKSVDSGSVQELAELAGTNGDGTSMLGLVMAAAAKGLELTGVESADWAALPAPFLAFVDDGHFVYVESVDKDSLRVFDATGPAKQIPAADFAERWRGQALVAEEPLQTVARLAIGAMETLVGGDMGDEEHHGPLEFPNDPDPDEPDPTCNGCDCDGTGGGNGVGVSPDCGGGGGGNNGDPGSPTAYVGIGSPGVNPIVNSLTTGLYVNEVDLWSPNRGPMELMLRRAYMNDKGYERDDFSDPAKPWAHMGVGWSHTYSMHLKGDGVGQSGWVAIGGLPGRVVGPEFEYDEAEELYGCVAIPYDHGLTHLYCGGPDGPSIVYDGTKGEYDYTDGSGLTYRFSDMVASGSDYFARLEEIEDPDGETLTLEYDSTNVATGKLTKVVSSQGTGRNLTFHYDNNLITKVKLNKNTTVLQEVSYDYSVLDKQLTKVTDDGGDTVLYSYGTNLSASGSSFITRITDRESNDLDFTWTFGQDAGGSWEAHIIEVDYPSGLTTKFDRSITSGQTTITNWDNTTNLSKMINHPMPDNPTKSEYKDFYLDATNYERWTYEYDVMDLTKVLRPDSTVHQTYEYDDDGRLTASAFGNSQDTTYAYKVNGQYATKISTPEGYDTTIEYDADERITKVKPPHLASAGVVYVYDSYGQVLTKTDALGNDTLFTYDSNGFVTEVEDAEGNSVSFDYDDFGNVTKVTDPRLKETDFEYITGGCSGCGGSPGILTKVIDANDEDTKFYYDKNGNMTKVTDALNRDTTYDYDTMNRLTKITVPGGDTMTYAYNVLGQLTKVTDFEANDTTHAYDFRSNVTKVTDPVDFVTMTYTNQNQLLTVTDGKGNVFKYGYKPDGMVEWFRDEALLKTHHYAYDEDNRVTKTQTGIFGGTDITEYLYSATSGLLSKVKYPGSPSTYDANYFYDGGARLTKITDWMGGGGLRYAYDDAGRLTTITDYDNSVLTYTYDASGNVITMDDYHSNDTIYTYTDTNQLSTITAPGSKVWTYQYNAIGQPTEYEHPNGMDTVYSYDGRNRLTKIEHKDGVTVKDSFAYVLDDVGNVESVEQVDGSVWDYWYDGRYRLTKAVRDNAQTSPTITATYEYAYDDGDNMLTKEHPFEDAFDDGDHSGWTRAGAVDWDTTGEVVTNPNTTAYHWLRLANTDEDFAMWWSVRENDDTEANRRTYVYLRDDNANSDYLIVQQFAGSIVLKESISGTATNLDSATVTIDKDVWYDWYAIVDGADVTVYRGERGGAMEEVLSTTSADGTMATTRFQLYIALGAEYSYDNFRIVSDDLDATTTYAYNAANELTTMTQPDGSDIDFEYDLWGRMTKKALGTTYEATYAYRYFHLLQEVTTDWPDENDVSYEYGANVLRRERTIGATTTKYNWDASFTVINEENSGGTLTRTYVGQNHARVDGSNPSTGDYEYYYHDSLSSSREIRAQDKSSVASYEPTPYGDAYTATGDGPLERGFTGHQWDAAAGLYYAPYRYYSPQISRWNARDGLNMIDGTNMYAYVANDPVNWIDPDGLKIKCKGNPKRRRICKEALERLKKCSAEAKELIDKLEAHDEVINIVPSKGDSDSEYEKEKNKAHYNPKTGPNIPPSEGGPVEPETPLLHELIHAWQDVNGFKPNHNQEMYDFQWYVNEQLKNCK